MNDPTPYLREIHRIALGAEEGIRRTRQIERICEAAFAGQPIPDGSGFSEQPLRRLVRKLLRLTRDRTHIRLVLIGWLKEGRVPADPDWDPVEVARYPHDPVES